MNTFKYVGSYVGKLKILEVFTRDSTDTLSASDFFQYFNPSNGCLQVLDLIEFFLPKLSPMLKKGTL